MERDKEEQLGWCPYCKEPVYLEERHIEKKGKYYHLYCYNVINGKYEELNFD